MDWEEYVAEISTDMLREQSPKRSHTLVTRLALQFVVLNISCVLLQFVSGAWEGIRAAS